MLLKRENGFTLIEMLLSLTIMLIVAHLFLQSMFVVQPLQKNEREMNPLEWELFLHNLKRDIRMAESSSVAGNTLYYFTNGKQYSVSMYNNIMRRQADGKGHVIMLHNVGSFKAEETGRFIKVTVTDLSNKKYNANLLFYHE
ncbi:MAG: competence type IV pilus minor pilin ComGF [Bacillus sp. (in: firmicutes)]